MSTESTADVYYDVDRTHKLIREHYSETGTPPSRRDIGERDDQVCDGYYAGGNVPSKWSGVVRAAGVPSAGEAVANHFHELWADRYPWQDSLVRSVKAISKATGMSIQQTVHGLKDARENEALEVMDGFEFVRQSQNAGATTWRFRPVGGGE